MRKHLTDEIKRQQDNTLNMAFILSQDENLINALKTKNKSLLNYDNTLLFLHDNRDYKNLWLQIVLIKRVKVFIDLGKICQVMIYQMLEQI